MTLALFCKHEMVEKAYLPLEIIYACKGGCGRITKVSITCEHRWVSRERAVAEPVALQLDVADLGDLSAGGQRRLLGTLTGAVDVLFECVRCHVFYQAKLVGRPTAADELAASVELR